MKIVPSNTNKRENVVDCGVFFSLNPAASRFLSSNQEVSYFSSTEENIFIAALRKVVWPL